MMELNKTVEGNALAVLKTFPDESIHCCITSPPYYQQRKYNTQSVNWGDWIGELGLEPSPELYVKHLLQIFIEVKRVLRKDGTLFVNIGDKTERKQMLQMPHRFSIAMTDELGMKLRRDIIWQKPGIMPTSQKDNFSLDYENIFFFTKQDKYYFEQPLEPANYDGRKDTKFKGSQKYNSNEISPDGNINTFAKEGHERWTEVNGIKMRTMRSVWNIPSEPLSEKHFATYPQKLIERIIKYACPECVCNKCNKPILKIYKRKSDEAFNIRVRDVKAGRIKHTDRKASIEEVKNYNEKGHYQGKVEEIVEQKCNCNKDFHPGVILDPFIGSGTTGIVARKLNRNYIGIDLQYHELNEIRHEKELGFFR
jgi:site-specific DNA-methyltransferase (adenine-specific)